MSFSFKAVIYKVGINPCVDVPVKITSRLKALRGYIPVTGKINGHYFQQNLVPVKDGPYRLYVNIPMLKGGNAKVGEKAQFEVEADNSTPKKVVMPSFMKTTLEKSNLIQDFKKLITSRQKEIIKYMSSLKSDEARSRNMDKIEKMLQEKRKSMW